MTPEEKARIKIDQWFADAGWKVVNREDYEPTCTAVAIREGLLKGNLEADYFLFINGKAVGVLEAKREETDAFASKVCEQATLYARSVPNIYQAYQKPLPFIFTSNGKELYCCDFREQDSCFKQIMAIPTPHELVKKLGIEDTFAGLPTLKRKGLRDCQYEAVTELEKSFRAGQNRALMVLATGAGKTYTACLAAYRMLSYTPMRRVLFLVDRNNLGKQAEGEFGTFRLTENGDAFNTIFTVNRLRSSSIPSDSNVVISTIQRLFSFLKGETIEDNDDDDENEPVEEVILPPNPKLPHDYFDMIIIDECHRSIYGNWRKVLEYFDTARLVGLTATPIEETKKFFNYNIIVNYTLEKSIVDGVNVDCRVYRIKTQVTETGGAILEGERVKEETRYTGEVKTVRNKETKTYTNKELNRSVINPAQIKLILSTYRDVVYAELFNDPQREPNMDYEPITYSMLKDLENRLKMANNHFTSKQLWNSYAIVNPKVVRRSITKEESDALTNIIQLVRFAFHQIERLDSVVTTSKQFFNLWLGQNQREITDKQREVISRIVDYIASNGACTIRDIREDDATHAAQMIRAFGNMQKADEALHSLYTFVVLRKAA